MKRRTPVLFLGGLALGLAVAILAYAGYTWWRSLNPPEFLPGDGSSVGQPGPVGLRFEPGVDQAAAEARLHFQPDVRGEWRWEGQTAWFDPRPAFAAGQRYTLRMEASPDGPPGGAWSFLVRAPQVAYLSPSGGGREVWSTSLEGSLPRQLTRTGGQVVDFSPARDGSVIYFSAANEAGGVDIWRVERSGEHQTRLVDCGKNWCSGVEASPDGSRFSYSQRSEQRGQAVPYLYHLNSGKNEPLYSDTLIRGEDFVWSPDGRKLALYDSGAGAVRLHDFSTARDTLFESNLPGPVSWSPDGQKLIFLTEDRQSGFTRVVIYEADLEKQNLLPLWADVVGDDSGLPVWSPLGDVLLFSQRILSGSASRQLYLIRPDGSGLSKVTDDLLFTHAAYSWSPDGQQVLFQRLAFGSSGNRPEGMLWDRKTGGFIKIAENAASPRWLP